MNRLARLTASVSLASSVPRLDVMTKRPRPARRSWAAAVAALNRPLWQQSSSTMVDRAADCAIISLTSDAFTAVDRSRSTRVSRAHR